jgi:hypothetical protein
LDTKMIHAKSQRFRALVSTAVACAAVAFASSASAGTLQIKDPAHVLSPDDAGHLRAVVGTAPFDARLVFTSEYADSDQLSRYIGNAVSEPDMVVVGVDPTHHHVQVHFGTGSGIARSSYGSIESSGNDAFRQHDWRGGAAAIFEAATRAANSNRGTTAPDVAPAPAPHVSLLGPVLLVLLIGGAVAAIAFFARRSSMQGGVYPGPGMGGGYGGPPYGPYGGGPGGGMGPVGGGLIGAGLGGLAGYELGKVEGEREGRARDDYRDDRVDRDGSDGGKDYDAGGGGSSWDDGSGGSDGGGDSGGGGGSDF